MTGLLQLSFDLTINKSALRRVSEEPLSESEP